MKRRDMFNNKENGICAFFLLIFVMSVYTFTIRGHESTVQSKKSELYRQEVGNWSCTFLEGFQREKSQSTLCHF